LHRQRGLSGIQHISVVDGCGFAVLSLGGRQPASGRAMLMAATPKLSA